MKLIIAGSRDITDYELVRKAVIISGFWKRYGKSIEVVCGMARGVDLLGKEFAERNGLIVHEFPADWKKLGKSAGPMRNRQMGDFADGLLAIWDGVSSGTKHMIGYARERNLEGFVFRTDKTLRYTVGIGDIVYTDYSGKKTKHTVKDIVKSPACQSGVMLQVTPNVPKSGDAWVDSDWFTY